MAIQVTGKRLIRVSSRALGDPRHVRVYVYDDLAHMRRDADAFSVPGGMDDALGVCQAWTDKNGRAGAVLVRLVRGHLGTQIVTHEMHHASAALYGAHLHGNTRARTVLNHTNEEFAHLFSDLCCRLVRQLYANGYYDPNDDE